MLPNTPAGLDEIIHTFGSLNDPTFEARNLVAFDLPYPLTYAGNPVSRARCHRLLVDNFTTAFAKVKEAGLVDQFTEYNGIYERRPIRGQQSHASCHSWGIAIDMCASRFPLGSLKRMDPAIVKIWNSCGFFYGGDFISRKDPMHFQFATHY